VTETATIRAARAERGLVIVAILKVRRSELAAFREFETLAARILLEHEGRLERTVVADDGASDILTEIHVVRFASETGFAEYRQDPRLLAAQPLREVSLVETSLFVGEDGPDYA
jgi:hypothetical protein